jgi:hypothetical protein
MDSLSSCEIAGSEIDNYGYLRAPKSPDLSNKSEVICSFSFKEVKAGTTFNVSGTVLRTCERFSINLLAVGNKQDTIALHFNPRIPQNYIVRNSKLSSNYRN